MNKLLKKTLYSYLIFEKTLYFPLLIKIFRSVFIELLCWKLIIRGIHRDKIPPKYVFFWICQNKFPPKIYILESAKINSAKLRQIWRVSEFANKNFPKGILIKRPNLRCFLPNFGNTPRKIPFSLKQQQ